MTVSTGLGVGTEVGTMAEPAGQPATEVRQQQGEQTTQQPAVDLAKVRELILQAHPAVIPELVQGDSFDALIASVEGAEAAYARIAESVKAAQQQPAAPNVSAGQPANGARSFVVNIEELSSEGKIAEGIRRARQQK